jgi:hypothetical protein
MEAVELMIRECDPSEMTFAVEAAVDFPSAVVFCLRNARCDQCWGSNVGRAECGREASSDRTQKPMQNSTTRYLNTVSFPTRLMLKRYSLIASWRSSMAQQHDHNA